MGIEMVHDRIEWYKFVSGECFMFSLKDEPLNLKKNATEVSVAGCISVGKT